MRIINLVNILNVLLLINLLQTKSQGQSKQQTSAVLTFVIEKLQLINQTTKSDVEWNTKYENQSSKEFIGLFQKACNLVLRNLKKIVPSGSNGEKCEIMKFEPTNNKSDSGTFAKAVIKFEYHGKGRFNREENLNVESIHKFKFRNLDSSLEVIGGIDDVQTTTVENPIENPQTAQTPQTKEEDRKLEVSVFSREVIDTTINKAVERDWIHSDENSAGLKHHYLNICGDLIEVVWNVVPPKPYSEVCKNTLSARMSDPTNNNFPMSFSIILRYNDAPNINTELLAHNLKNTYLKHDSKLKMVNPTFIVQTTTVENPTENPQTTRTPQTKEEDAMLEVHFTTPDLVSKTTNSMILWNYTFFDEESPEFLQLSSDVCEQFLPVVRSDVSLKSSSEKCEVVSFKPEFYDSEIGVQAEVKLIFVYSGSQYVDGTKLNEQLSKKYKSLDNFYFSISSGDELSVQTTTVENPTENPQTAQTPHTKVEDAKKDEEDKSENYDDDTKDPDESTTMEGAENKRDNIADIFSASLALFGLQLAEFLLPWFQ